MSAHVQPGLPLVLPLICVPTAILGCLQCDPQFKENVSKLRTIVVPRQIHDTRLKERAEALLKGLEGDFFLHYATSQFSGLAGTAVAPLSVVLLVKVDHGTSLDDLEIPREKLLEAFAIKRKVDHLIQEVRSSTESLLQTTLTDQALLEKLVSFRKTFTMKLKRALKEHQMKACDKQVCANSYRNTDSARMELMEEKGSRANKYLEELLFGHSPQNCPADMANGSAGWRTPRVVVPKTSINYQVFNCKGCQTLSPSCLTLSQCFVDGQERLSLRYGRPLKDPNIARTGVSIVLCMGALLFLVIVGAIVVYWRNQLFVYV